jgi:hypothetical protein
VAFSWGGSSPGPTAGRSSSQPLAREDQCLRSDWRVSPRDASGGASVTPSRRRYWVTETCIILVGQTADARTSRDSGANGRRCLWRPSRDVLGRSDVLRSVPHRRVQYIFPIDCWLTCRGRRTTVVLVSEKCSQQSAMGVVTLQSADAVLRLELTRCPTRRCSRTDASVAALPRAPAAERV